MSRFERLTKRLDRGEPTLSDSLDTSRNDQTRLTSNMHLEHMVSAKKTELTLCGAVASKVNDSHTAIVARTGASRAHQTKSSAHLIPCGASSQPNIAHRKFNSKNAIRAKESGNSHLHIVRRKRKCSHVASKAQAQLD